MPEANEIIIEWELHDVLYDAQKMLQRVERFATENHFEQTLMALPLMHKYHEGQVRSGKDKAPYEVHPLTLACHAIAMGLYDDDLLASCLLHDVIEDCEVSIDELPVNDEVKEAVLLLTENGKTIPEYFRAISQNGMASVVKLLDRCNNISGMAAAFSKTKMTKYITETEKYVMPLISIVRENYPQYSDAAFLIKYQMGSVLETAKHFIKKGTVVSSR